MVTRRITYRLYPNRSQETQLHWARRMQCCLYNAAVANRKTQYHRFNHKVDYFEQQNCLPEFKEVWTEYKKLGSHSLQRCDPGDSQSPRERAPREATLKRVDFAFQRFLKGLAKYPKFKSSRHYRGWTYPCKSGWKVSTNNGVNGQLELRDLKLTIQMRGKARTWGVPKTCTIVWDNNKWYASITVECAPKRQTGTGSVGLDFGSKTAIATSDGELIESPKFLKQAQAKITQLSSIVKTKEKTRKTQG